MAFKRLSLFNPLYFIGLSDQATYTLDLKFSSPKSSNGDSSEAVCLPFLLDGARDIWYFAFEDLKHTLGGDEFVVVRA